MIRLQDFLDATGGTIHGTARSQAFADFAYDSRIVQSGQLFLAVVTETGDGHDYIADACRAGATGVVCQRLPSDLPSHVTSIVVPDTQAALLDYARHVMSQSQMQVVGVTGSVGKTSTKEAVAAVLSTRYRVFKNHGNYNGRFGLPIALGRLTGDEEVAVLEMACDGFDEIRLLAEATRPSIGVITSVGHSHLRFFGTVDQIAQEKGRLLESLPAEGTAVLNADDSLVRAMATRTRARVMTYGLDPRAEVWADGVYTSAEGTSLRAHFGGSAAFLRLPLVGAHHAYTALAAASVGLASGLTWVEIAAGLATVTPLPGRTRPLPGVNGSLLLDDSYNASPESTRVAIETLSTLAATRRIIVLGDMAQLGDHAVEAHQQAGIRCARAADLFVTIGELAQVAAEAALSDGLGRAQVHVAFSAEDVLRLLLPELREGDLVLIKGSASARMEEITRGLLRAPNAASELLPRQHQGWKKVRPKRPGRPTWVEIDLRAIAHNVRRTRELLKPDVDVLAVLTADGYGHGATKVARTALNNGVTWLGVACVGEATALRQAGIAAPILVLGYTPPWQARDVVLGDATATVFSIEGARALARAGEDLGRVARVHLKVDTGMGRLGLLPSEVPDFAQSVASMRGIEIDGVFSHFSSADEADLSYARRQLEQFEGVLLTLRGSGLLPKHIHIANSAAILRMPDSHYNMVRLGLAMFGLDPSSDCPCPSGFLPALNFKSQVAQVKNLAIGSAIGYGRAFTTKRPSRIAVIPVGYADGFRRGPTHWGHVLVRGERAPIVGRVCMDQTMIDVTDIPAVRQGDEVVLIGAQGAEQITVDQVARRLGTINYEVVSEILARVPRVV